MPEISVLAVAKTSVRIFFLFFPKLLLLCLVAAIGNFLFVGTVGVAGGLMQTIGTKLPGAGSLVQAASFLFQGLCLLAIHRYLLLGWRRDSWRIGLHWSRRELKFLLAFGACYAPILAMRIAYDDHLLPRNDAIAIYFASVMGVLFLLSRLVFIFPAIAEDHSRPLRHAQELGKGASRKMLRLLFLIAAPPIVLDMVLLEAEHAGARNMALASALVSRATVIVLVIAVCQVYRQLAPAPAGDERAMDSELSGSVGQSIVAAGRQR
jgi:hypothetical protein